LPLPLRLRASEVARFCDAQLEGEDPFLEALASPENAGQTDLVIWFRAGKSLPIGVPDSVAILCLPDQALGQRTRLVHPNPLAALQKLLEGPCAPAPVADHWLSDVQIVSRFGKGAWGARIHPAAEIHPSVRLAPGVVVEAGCSIAADSILEAGCILHRGTHLDAGCRIGSGTVLGSPGFGLVPDATGFAVLPHHAGVVLGKGVHLGPLCNVSAGILDATSIGSGSHLDAQVQVGHNCHIGCKCRIAAQTGLSGSVRLGDRCLVGGQAGFADHVTLGNNCIVAARAGVTKNWPDGTSLGGFPARQLSQWRRDLARRA